MKHLIKVISCAIEKSDYLYTKKKKKLNVLSIDYCFYLKINILVEIIKFNNFLKKNRNKKITTNRIFG